MTIDDRIEFLMQSIESHDRPIGENNEDISQLTGQIAQIKSSVATLGRVTRLTNDDATAIRTLTCVAEAHS